MLTLTRCSKSSQTLADSSWSGGTDAELSSVWHRVKRSHGLRLDKHAFWCSGHDVALARGACCRAWMQLTMLRAKRVKAVFTVWSEASYILVRKPELHQFRRHRF